MTTITETITPLSTPPSRSDPANFVARADTFHSELPTLATELNTVIGQINTVSGEVNTNATVAAASAIDAEAAYDATVAAANATKWVSGVYAEGAVVWSPTNGQAYRRKAPGGSSPTDPYSDSTNWYSLITLEGLILVEISSNTTAVAGRHYILNPAGSSYTLLLPGSPVNGNSVGFTNMSGRTDCVIDPNGETIRGVSGNMTINSLNAEKILRYATTSKWV